MFEGMMVLLVVCSAISLVLGMMIESWLASRALFRRERTVGQPTGTVTVPPATAREIRRLRANRLEMKKSLTDRRDKLS